MKRLRFLAAALAFVWAPFAASADLFSTPVQLHNAHLSIAFDRVTGSLTQLLDTATSRSFLAAPLPPRHAIWQATLHANDSTKTITLSPLDAHILHCELKGDTVLLRWERFDSPLPARLAVQASITLPSQSKDSHWNISIEGLDDMALTQVRFPCLPPLAQLPGERLAIPVWMGQETAKARQLVNPPDGKAQRLEWGYPGLLSMQCMALTSEQGAGLYFAGNDTAAYHKSFAVVGNAKGGLLLEQTHLPELAQPVTTTSTDNGSTSSTQSWKMPYDAIVGTLDGDGGWFAAAERYRAWAGNQPWVRSSRLHTGSLPAWLRECDLWVWNRGRSSQVLEPATALSRQLGLPVGVFWHWWHACPYDIGFPEYFPPREGNESFSAALGKAHAQGLHAIVYMNQRLWGMTTPSWLTEKAERFAVKRPDGHVQPEIYNVFTSAPCATMCMGTQFWRDKYASLAERAWKQLQVDGVYMDQACSSLACYDATHGHPVGGGRYWMQGFRLLQQNIRERCASNRPPAVLAGEGVAECWLPYLDLMLSLEVSRERYMGVGDWEVIPFFHAVYHSDALIYGNYSSLASPPYDELWPAEYAPKTPGTLLDRRYSRQFALEQARSFVWGQQLTVANYQSTQSVERREEIEQVLRLARLRRTCAAYLRDGTMLQAPQIDLPETTIPVSRLSIYAGRTPAAVRSYEKPVPQALAAAWRNPSGQAAVALASTADTELTVPLQLEACPWTGTKPLHLYRIDENGRTSLGQWQPSPAPLKVNLAPRGACVIEFSGES